MRAWGGSAVVVGLAVLVVMNVIPPAQAADDRVPASASILTVGSSDQMKMRNLLTAMLLDDPHTMAVLARVYDTPVQRDATTGNVTPRLAVGIDQNGNGRLDGSEVGVFDISGTTVTVFYDFVNARFHDGVPVTAADVLFSYHVLALNPVASGPLRPLMDLGGGPGSNFTIDRWLWVLPVDDGDSSTNTSALRFTLASAYAPFPWTTLGIPILPRHEFEGTGGGRHPVMTPPQFPAGCDNVDWGLAIYPETDARFGQGVRTDETSYRPFQYPCAGAWQMTDADVIGSGHFRFGTWSFGSFVRLDVNLDYAFGAPRYNGIIFKIYRTTQLLVLALQSGEIDLILGTLPPEFLPDLESDPRIGLVEAPDLFPKVLLFNMRRVPFGYDPFPPSSRASDLGFPFRQAMVHLIDSQTIVRVLFQDHAVVAQGMVSPFNDGWLNGTLPNYGYDPTRAALILDNAGWTKTGSNSCQNDGTNCRNFPRLGTSQVEILTPQADYNPALASSGAMIAAAARSVGVNVISRPTAFGTILSRVGARDFDLAILSRPDVHANDPWTLSRGDPDYLFDLFHSSNAAAGRNVAGFSDTPFDSAADRSRASPDFPTRSREVGWEQGILADQLPFIPIYYPNVTWAYRNDRFTGWVLVGSTVFNYWTLQNLESATSPPNPGPTIVLNSPPDGAIFPRGTVVDLTVTDSDLSFAYYVLDGAYVSNFSPPWDIDTAPWSEGTHTLDVTAGDSVGNTTRASFSFTTDSLPPSIDLASPANNSIVRGGTTLNFAVSDPHLAMAALRIDGGAPSDFLFPYDVPMAGLADGRHTFLIEATDAAGNTASAQFAVTLDTTAPTVVDYGPRGDLTGTIAAITARFSEAVNRSSVEAAFHLTDGAQSWDAGDGTFYWTADDASFVFVPDANLTQGTTYQVRLAGTLTDVLGNSMGSNLTWSFTLPRPSTQTPVGVGAAWVAVIVLLAAIVVSLLVLLLRRRRQGGVATINPEPPRP